MATSPYSFSKAKGKMELSFHNKFYVSLGPAKIYKARFWPLLTSVAALHMHLRTEHSPPFNESPSLPVDRQCFEFKVKLQSQSEVLNEHFFLFLFPLIRAKPNKYHSH